MLVKTFGSAVFGVDAITIEVEVNEMAGREYYLVGLPDSAVKESFQRVESALKTNGYFMPRRKLVVNLAPAAIRKSGTAFDLAIAIGILAATEQIPHPERLLKTVLKGELQLDGTIRPVKGALPIAINAIKDGFSDLFVPQQNAREAGVVEGLNVFGVAHINDVIDHFKGEKMIHPTKVDIATAFASNYSEADGDFMDVKGQENIKRSLEIAAAGGHNAILIGPPGAGKTMLASRLPTILPPLTLEEALETTKIYSVAGKLLTDATLITARPFRAPHHTASDMSLVGGGSIPQPGEISLSHNGVLFMDEFPEFRRTALEVMRQPMEERKLTISRARMSVDFPASFMLLAAMNPCPCGYYNHPEKSCSCHPGAVQKYLSKISAPLLDRIDLHVEVTPVPFSDLEKDQEAESSALIRDRVIHARQRQAARYRHVPAIYCNAQMTKKLFRQVCTVNAEGKQLLRSAMEKLKLSARAYDRILKVSRTIADLAGIEEIRPEHLAEAIQYRSLDRENWGE
ncbi:MAG: YifB family Mg chelatase-like AAA ATPase [Chitinophagaceae bacterium]|nr:YifB family Mg chelatase-like AAA ATPase [Chitinophagaceae bacterium]